MSGQTEFLSHFWDPIGTGVSLLPLTTCKWDDALGAGTRGVAAADAAQEVEGRAWERRGMRAVHIQHAYVSPIEVCPIARVSQ